MPCWADEDVEAMMLYEDHDLLLEMREHFLDWLQSGTFIGSLHASGPFWILVT